MYDIIYFGYPYDDEAPGLEQEFIEEINEKFPDFVINNAYDSIKGYRRTVEFDDEDNKELRDEYHCWLIGKGWLECSLNLSVMGMDKDQKEEFKRIIELTREKYPEAFKK